MAKKKSNVKNKDYHYHTFGMEIKDESNEGNQSKQNEGEDEYDPHLHRQVEKPTTNTETLIHMLKACLGTGILAMPQAFMYAGMINGIISTICIAILTTYCFHIMVKAQYVLCKLKKVPLLTYPESMQVACEVGPKCLRIFAPSAPHVTNFFLIFNQLGICCVYVLFVAVNIKDVVEVHIDPTTFPKEAYIGFIFISFLLIMCLPDLKILTPFSTVANIITVVTFCVVIYYVSQNLKNFGDIPVFGTLFNYPLFVGTALFALQSVGVLITLENNMRNPKEFGGYFGVMNIGMFIITIIYVAMATLGYWRYGDDIQDSITLNFPPKEILGQVIKLLYTVAIFISYGLQGFVSVYILWIHYVDKRVEKKVLWHYVIRIICVLFTFILAATVPLLGYFISLVGAVSLSALGITFPAILDICSRWPNDLGRFRWKLIKDIILIIMGVIGLSAGSFSCIYSMVVELSKGRT